MPRTARLIRIVLWSLAAVFLLLSVVVPLTRGGWDEFWLFFGLACATVMALPCTILLLPSRAEAPPGDRPTP